MNTFTSGEQMLSEVTALVYEMVPNVDVEKMKAKLSNIFSGYHVQKVEEDEVHPDLTDKIGLFLSAKQIEGLSPITLDGYKRYLNIFANQVKKRTHDVTAADIRVFLGQYSDQKPATIETKLSCLKSFFKWLQDEEIIERDPARKIKSPKIPKRPPKALKIEELEMLREGCESVRQRAFLEVMYATGCRLSEIQSLDKDDINQQEMSASVVGKGDKQRKVYFSFKAMYHLNKYLEMRNDDIDALFVTLRKPYRRISGRAIQDEINKIAKQSDIDKHVTPHQLRHTFATLTLNNGAELSAVQDLLGHSSADTTAIYAQLTDERKQEQHKKYLVQ